MGLVKGLSEVVLVLGGLNSGILLYMLDKSICHFRAVGTILWLLFYF